MLKTKLLLLALILIAAAGLMYRDHQANPPLSSAAQTAKSASSSGATTPKPTNYCADNTLDQQIVVSISRQHLWACEKNKSVYDSPVITGMEMYPADLTPVGTYHIYGKQANQTLTGSDDTGSWNDPVSYWEPFLYNKYGTYGFHDATWRSNSDFGKIDVNAPFTTTDKSGSHGCVELPLATAKWIYDWSVVGTTVVIQS